MQDRYAGDIGDYGKFALLRAIRAQGLSVGVNWYCVEPLDVEMNEDGSYKQEDGKYLIPDRLHVCDKKLAKTLTDIARLKTRSINAMEKQSLIPGAKYYRDPVTVEEREGWHARALTALNGVDIVFLDPDNGMLVKSVRKESVRSVKYVFYEEIRDYIKRGQSVLVYNHRGRKQEGLYFRELYHRLSGTIEVPEENLLAITFPKCSVRDYIAITASRNHYIKLKAAMDGMAEGIWGQMGVCRIPEMKEVRGIQIEDIREFFDKQRWIFAKTYAQKAPHEYIVRHKHVGTDDEFLGAVDYILNHGITMYFWNHPNKYIFLDNRQYWVMRDSEGDPTTIINRCNLDEYKLSITWKGPKTE